MSIQIQQPQPYDIVGDDVQLAGLAGGAFEASYSYVVHDGHDEVTGHFMAGDGIGGHGQFQVVASTATSAMVRPQAFVEVFHVSAKDGSRLDQQVVPVLLGSKIVPGYTTYLEHEVQAGETLWGIAVRHYGRGDLYHRIVTANPATITNPNLITPGTVLRVPRA